MRISSKIISIRQEGQQCFIFIAAPTKCVQIISVHEDEESFLTPLLSSLISCRDPCPPFLRLSVYNRINLQHTTIGSA